MVSNSDMETWWVESWSELYDPIGDRLNVRCLLPDGKVVDVETCKGWIQDTAYAGQRAAVAEGWVIGRPGVHVSLLLSDDGRFPPE